MKTKKLAFILIAFMAFSLSACHNAPNGELEESSQPTSSDRVTLRDSVLKQLDLKIEPVQSREVILQIPAVAQVKVDDNRVFHINSFVSGRVMQDLVQLGGAIRQGQTLAVVQNLDVAKVQAESIHQMHQNEIDVRQAKIRLQLAEKNLKREKQLLTEGISPRKDYLQAEADATLAHSELQGQQEHSLHLKEEAAALLGAYGITRNDLRSEKIRTGSPVLAPRAGVITKKTVTLGDMVTPDMVMYEVADLSQVWLDLTVFSKDVASVRVGDTVQFVTDSLPGKQFVGKVNYLQPNAVDANSTYVARVFLSNTQHWLKPGMIGQSNIQRSEKQIKAFVPEQAVQRYGREAFVFVVNGPNQFRKQVVQLGEKIPNGYWLNSGVAAGTSVVTHGSFTLKAEMLKHQFAEEE